MAQQWQRISSQRLDFALLLPAIALALIGYVMITSASMDVVAVKFNDPFYQSKRQLLFMVLGLASLVVCLMMPVDVWHKQSPWLLLLAVLLLIAVLIPGLGRSVNGSTRWIPIGPLSLQPSEFAKLAVVAFMAGYLVRRQDEVRTQFSGFLKPLVVLGLFIVLFLLEPDFGAVVVMMAAVLGMFFLGGMRKLHIGAVVVAAGALGTMTIFAAEYRVKRLMTYLDPWGDPFGSGYQLTQAQIAFGRGGWFGEGLGQSMQKLFYLPEAHTDFVYSVLAEEWGAMGALVVVALYGVLIVRGLKVGQQAETLGRQYSAYLAYGLVLLIAAQAMINIGVNLGLLPTKGLTLPFVSYGGSSMLACAGSLGILLRISLENSIALKQPYSPSVDERQ
ncbi:MAG: putative lipid II flippase FtsW, partial [Oceanospirillaceae bacterium]|nr:putative lipid II flippase FtsW [Oceanospirillaceae bacterium]